MPSKAKWNDLPHAKRLEILANTRVDQIAREYDAGDIEDFVGHLNSEKSLWTPGAYQGGPKEMGEPPNKEVVLGAWRDLDRSEAILELIDNSIDAWQRRRKAWPKKCAPELNIYVDIDDAGQLMYEDNAGGVPTAKLVNLVVPGHSETESLEPTIGSYKTGGKKAIFRLATAVNISTHYWNHAETGDEAVSVHLDHNWLTDPLLYKFPYFTLKEKGQLERGQTRYVMQLRVEPTGNPWYADPQERQKIENNIRRTYGLLISREPNINVYFAGRGNLIKPKLEDLYDFSASANGKTDIRPQRVRFTFSLDYEGKPRPLTIEIVIGCRTSGAIRDDRGPGFDLYGNDRMFVHRDQDLLADFFPKGSISNYIRGFVNIIGPNVFVPWDTHKRYLNYDREVIQIIRTHPAIRELFNNWKDAFGEIRNSPEVTRTVGKELTPLIDPITKDLALPHVNDVAIDANRKRGQTLPNNIFKPTVKAAAKKRNRGFQLNIVLTNEEARQLAAKLGVEGDLDSGQFKRTLAEEAREYLFGTRAKSGKKP